MRTFEEWCDSREAEKLSSTSSPTLAAAAYQAGQLAAFHAIHELSYKTKSSEELVLRIGMMYGELLKGAK